MTRTKKPHNASPAPRKFSGQNRGPENWRDQLAESARDLAGLREFFPDARLPDSLDAAIKRFPVRVTPYYASLVEVQDYSDPIFAQCVPQQRELDNPAWLSSDEFSEVGSTPCKHLIRRYPDRALLIATSTCAVKCRHCTRKHIEDGGCGYASIQQGEMEKCLSYLRSHPEIRDVLISGGDPLSFPNDYVEYLVSGVRSVKSVEIIRIATRMPATLPMRIEKRLVGMLAKHNPVYLNTHFNHPRELTAESEAALRMIADAGIPASNQTVLLRGVNDSADKLRELFRGLLRNRVRPYYLFQCDLVEGVEHFRTKLQVGIDIMHDLRGTLSGLGIPHFVVDLPGAGGKVELNYDSIVGRDSREARIATPFGDVCAYPEPRGNR